MPNDISVASSVLSSACDSGPARATPMRAATVEVSATNAVAVRARRSRCAGSGSSSKYRRGNASRAPRGGAVRGVGALVEVQADERLADPEAQQDRHEDDERQQRLAVAELRRRDVRRV